MAIVYDPCRGLGELVMRISSGQPLGISWPLAMAGAEQTVEIQTVAKSPFFLRKTYRFQWENHHYFVGKPIVLNGRIAIVH